MFNHGCIVKDINELYYPTEKNIDLKFDFRKNLKKFYFLKNLNFNRKLILFGLMKGLLRKLNKYPISLRDAQSTSDTSKTGLTGFLSYDKLCSLKGFNSISKIMFLKVELIIKMLQKVQALKQLKSN